MIKRFFVKRVMQEEWSHWGRRHGQRFMDRFSSGLGGQAAYTLGNAAYQYLKPQPVNSTKVNGYARARGRASYGARSYVGKRRGYARIAGRQQYGRVPMRFSAPSVPVSGDLSPSTKYSDKVVSMQLPSVPNSDDTSCVLHQTLLDIPTVASGTGIQSSRTGSTAYALRVEFRGYLRSGMPKISPGNTFETVTGYFFVILDTGCGGVGATKEQLFTKPTGYPGVNTFENQDNGYRFVTLYRKPVAISAQGHMFDPQANAQLAKVREIPFHFEIPLNFGVEYQSDTTTGALSTRPSANLILAYISFFSEGGLSGNFITAPHIIGDARVYFQDE